MGARCHLSTIDRDHRPEAERRIARYDLRDRATTHAANVFTGPWPAGHDAVLFSNVFHDWDRASCLHLARRASAALPPGGRVLVHELPPGDAEDGPLPAATMSLLMRYAPRGRPFTAAPLGALLQEAGFEAAAVTPAHGDVSLVCARRPGVGVVADAPPAPARTP